MEKCTKCNAEFETIESLTQHVNAKHFQPPVENSLQKLKKPFFYLVALLLVIGGVWLLYNWAASTPRIGPVGSTHIHQDLKIYLEGKQIDLSQQKYQVKVPYVHVEGGDGDVIHVHATGVIIGMFFDSLGMKFSKECFNTDEGRIYCNDGEKTLKFIVNGAANEEFDKYLLKDLDKILISYGSENQTEVQAQLNTITDKAKTAGNEAVTDPLSRHAAQ